MRVTCFVLYEARNVHITVRNTVHNTVHNTVCAQYFSLMRVTVS